MKVVGLAFVLALATAEAFYEGVLVDQTGPLQDVSVLVDRLAAEREQQQDNIRFDGDQVIRISPTSAHLHKHRIDRLLKVYYLNY